MGLEANEDLRATAPAEDGEALTLEGVSFEG